MKKSLFVCALALAAHGAFAQVVSYLSVTGSANVSAEAYHLVQKTGYTSGSGRGGGYVRKPYTYYVTVVDQLVNGLANYLPNAGAQNATATCTTYPSPFSASASLQSTYSEAGSEGVLNLATALSTDALPATTGLNHVISAASAKPQIYFTVPNDTIVTINLTGSLAATAGYSLYTTSTNGDPVVFYNSPNNYTVVGGFGYVITLSSVGVTGLAGIP